MPTLTKIKYSQLNDRFDSGYYRPDFLNLIRTLEIFKGKIPNLQDICKKEITYGSTPLQTEETYVKEGAIFFRSNQLNDFFLDMSEVVRISHRLYKKMKRSQISQRDILIATVGATIGAVSVVCLPMGEANCNQAVGIIRLKENYVPEYVAIFLLSKYGQAQIKRYSSGGARFNLDPFEVKKIKVPIPQKTFQQKIEKLVKESFQKRKLADEKYNQAKQFLEEELGLDKLRLKEEKNFEAKSSELFESGRFDVGFNKPKYSKINEFLEKNEKEKNFIVKRLKDVSKLFKGIEIGSNAYTNEGYLFFRVSNISEREITIGTSSQFVRPYLYEQLKSKYKPEIGDVLYTKDATIGISFVVDKDLHEFILSGGVVRIKPKDVDPYYLALVLNSMICKSQSERQSIGAVIKHFTFGNVKNLKIPLIPKAKQEQISTLIKESFSLRKQSKNLLEESKKVVERAIEKGDRK